MIKSENNSEKTVEDLTSKKRSAKFQTVFGNVKFTTDEQISVDNYLQTKLSREDLSRRPGPGGRKLTYLESWKAIELANRAFGFNGWSCEILKCKEEYRDKRSEKWYVGYSSCVRIQLKDGTSHEDIGFGTSEGQKNLGQAIEQATKASVSDARKRTLRLFGEILGNSCYDRLHVKEVHSTTKNQVNMNSNSSSIKVENQPPPLPSSAGRHTPLHSKNLSLATNAKKENTPSIPLPKSHPNLQDINHSNFNVPNASNYARNFVSPKQLQGSSVQGEMSTPSHSNQAGSMKSKKRAFSTPSNAQVPNKRATPSSSSTSATCSMSNNKPPQLTTPAGYSSSTVKKKNSFPGVVCANNSNLSYATVVKKQPNNYTSSPMTTPSIPSTVSRKSDNSKESVYDVSDLSMSQFDF